jgi:predicted  nucleic acid-binding Zn-ribbon protein
VPGPRDMSRWDALLVVQEHDTAVDQLEHRRRHLPEQAELDRLVAGFGGLDARAGEVEAQRHELARSQSRIEDEVASLTEKAAQHDKALYGGTVSNPRDLQAMQDEIASLQRRISQLEDQELELMERIEPLDAELAELAGERSRLDERAAALRAAIAEAEVSIEGELVTVRTEREAAAAGIEPELLAQYDSLRGKLGGIAIARMVGGHCQGCHLALSAVEVDRIRKLPVDEPATCEECGRLLAR